MNASNQTGLHGRTAVVTGSSSGVGQAIALELAKAGAALVVHGFKNPAGAEETVQQIQQLGGQATILMADVANIDDRDRLARNAWEWRGGVDVWVNNAGADVLTGPAADWSFEQKLDRLWQVDVVGAMLLSRTIGAQMKSQRRGVILNIGWDQADHGMAGESGEMFATIKGAVMAFSKSLAKSLAPEVRVNCIAPGWIKTSWGEQASDYWRLRAVKESLRSRWGTPEDVAAAARFLASDAADFITGHVLPVNGGFAGGAGERS